MPAVHLARQGAPPRDTTEPSAENVELRSWKKPWPAEKATFEEARALRRRLLKRWRQGNTRERELARIVERRRMGNRCEQ
jgi:hypothetical protein